MKKRVIASADAPAAVGPYSQAVSAGGLIFVSGQIPLDPETGAMAEGIEAQTARCLENVAAILKEAGAALGDVVKVTVFLTDLGAFARVNEVYASFFAEPFPARCCVEVSALPKGASVEIEAVALVPSDAR